MVERQPSKLNVASSSLVSRSITFLRFGPSSSGVERILGKDEVTGSNPVLGSRVIDFFISYLIGEDIEDEQGKIRPF